MASESIEEFYQRKYEETGDVAYQKLAEQASGMRSRKVGDAVGGE